MTIAQIKKAASKHEYLGLRLYSGFLIGYNSKCIQILIARSSRPINSKTVFQSYIPLSLNDYINCKMPITNGSNKD